VDVAVSVPDEAKVAAQSELTDQVPVEAGPICANCGAEALSGDLFCESCGAELPAGVAAAAAALAASRAAGDSSGAPADPTEGSVDAVQLPTQPTEVGPLSKTCTSCGGAIAEDGYCSTCGAPAVRERDHWLEQPAPWVAAVCDRGIRHHRNEDAVALSAQPEPGTRAILVVCDGVSSSLDSDIASLAAARAARDVLNLQQSSGPSVAGRITYWTDRLTEAANAANAEVVEVSRNPTGRPGERQDSPPSCTFVAAVVDGPVIIAGWVGDSRAYWLPDVGGAEQLSTDDSWASEQILSGVSRAEAESAPQAHAITRWLGVDSPDVEPRCAATTPSGPGWLLVCSDGLWNYCSAAPDVGLLVARVAAAAGGDPARTATELVNWANAQGGMDNITVALARLDAGSIGAVT
jgi:serine/threonine protein phosphatase PrpC